MKVKGKKEERKKERKKERNLEESPSQINSPERRQPTNIPPNLFLFNNFFYLFFFRNKIPKKPVHDTQKYRPTDFCFDFNYFLFLFFLETKSMDVSILFFNRKGKRTTEKRRDEQ